MIIKSNYYFYLILILFFLKINYNNGQLLNITSITSLSLSINKPEYYKYTKYSNCNLEYKIIVLNSDSSDSLLSFNSLPNTPELKLSDNNNSTYIYTLQITVAIGTSNLYNLTLLSKNNVEAIYQLNQTCSEITIDQDLTFELEGYPYALYTSFSSFFEVKEEDNVLFNKLADLGLVIHTRIKNYYLINSYNTWGLTSNWTNVITFSNGKTITLVTKSYWSQFELPNAPIDFKFYPSNFNSSDGTLIYREFGSNSKPFYKSTIQTELNRPFQFLCSDPSTNTGYYSTPIKGINGTMTYLGYIPSMDLDKIASSDQSTAITYPINVMFDTLPLPSLGPISLSLSEPSLSVNLFSISYSNAYKYEFTEFNYAFSYIETNKPWPFGFVSGNNLDYQHSVEFPKYQILGLNANTFYSFRTKGLYDGPASVHISCDKDNSKGSSGIQLVSFKCIRISSNNYLFSVDIISENGVDEIQFLQASYGSGYLVKGDIKNGTYEMIVNQFPPTIYIYDIYLNTKSYFNGDYISLNPLIKFESPFINNYANISNYSNITFSTNDLDLIDKDNYIIMYITSDQLPNDLDLHFIIGVSLLISSKTPNNIMEYTNNIIYNSTLNCFTGKFILKKNNIFGNFSFIYTFSSYGQFTSNIIPNFTNLRVNKTKFDNQGPQIMQMVKINNQIIINQGTSGSFGWNITITDDFNGFDRGYIKVMGTIDSSTYHFNFTVNDFISGNAFQGVYQLLINVPCLTQNYSIVYVELYDTNQILSLWDLRYIGISYTTPFMNLYEKTEDGGLSITTIETYCLGSTIDYTKPKLVNFTSSKSVIDVGAVDRSITFNFEIIPSASGVKKDQLPIIYLSTKRMKSLECKTELVKYDVNLAQYNCTLEIPLGFGFPHQLLLSIYGIINNGGQYHGFLTSDILAIPDAIGYINTTLTIDQPIITSNDKYYSDEKEILIYGRSLANIKSLSIVYRKDTGLPSQTISMPTRLITIIGSSVIKISEISPSDKPFTIQVVSNTDQESNIYKVIPIYFNLTPPNLIPIPTETPSPTSTSSPTSTPSPTPTGNPPQKCLGNPVCGGEKQGYCSDAGYCICISPWIGESCNSQIIIVPTPSINTSSPSVEIPTIPIDNGSNNGNLPEVLFKSFISLVSLREIDYNNQQVVNHKFDKWIYTSLSEFKNQYTTNVLNTINITATLEWFNKSTIVEFGNQKLSMNPSSIKYTIEIQGEYKFINQLNQLQLIMFASFESSKTNDICSNLEFGNTSNSGGDDDDYLKIQIDNHSLYGRFIKRAISDGEFRSVSNQLLDESLNTIATSSSIQTFIAITIPRFKHQIIVDPDFSVLVDSKAASSSSSNSICTSSSSKLTKAQLAGIIIGCIAFVIVIITIITYSIIKTKKQKQFIKNINKKMKNMQQ